MFKVVGVPYIIEAVGTAEHVSVVSQSGAIPVHFIGPCNPQMAQSFDRLRMMVEGTVLRQAQDEGLIGGLRQD